MYYEVRHLVEEVRRLRDAGETEMTSPVPIFDISVEEANQRRTDPERLYTHDLYSDERLYERARLVVEEALKGYAEILETFFGKLAPHMPMAATLPCRLVGHLELRSGPREDSRVIFYLDPLCEGADSATELQLGQGPSREGTVPYLRRRIAALRPQAAGWLPPRFRRLPPQGSLLDLTPVTKTVSYWLWDDLRYAKWTDRMNPWWP